MISATTIREGFETDLSDAAIGRMILGEFEEVARRHRFTVTVTAGTGDDPTEYSVGAGDPMIIEGLEQVLSVPVSARIVDELTFEEWDYSDEAWVELDDTDLELETTRRYRRLGSGAHKRWIWSDRVRVTPTFKSELIESVIADLVRLKATYNALTSERAGDYSASAPDYQKERESIIGTLQQRSAVA